MHLFVKLKEKTMRLLLLTSMHSLRCLFVTTRTDFKAALNDCLGKKTCVTLTVKTHTKAIHSFTSKYH